MNPTILMETIIFIIFAYLAVTAVSLCIIIVFDLFEVFESKKISDELIIIFGPFLLLSIPIIKIYKLLKSILITKIYRLLKSIIKILDN